MKVPNNQIDSKCEKQKRSNNKVIDRKKRKKSKINMFKEDIKKYGLQFILEDTDVLGQRLS